MGYFSVFFLALEGVTGAWLMVCLVPNPEGAYPSILALNSTIPFGSLIRDLHRLGGELMLIVATLHMVRVFLVGAYGGLRRLTWLTGALLWLMTLLLAFSGYLLPWDQLAFWAVTIGTSIVKPIPLVGHELTLLLRGGPIFNGDGLLRFYLLHILIIPALFLVVLAIHYYRVIRLHGLFLPIPHRQDRSRPDHVPGRPFLPAIPLVDCCLALGTLILLVATCTWLYDAPFQHHADPLKTPTMTRAPWFFLWLQGLLKLGDRLMMGILVPACALLLLIVFPYAVHARTKYHGIAVGRLLLVLGLSGSLAWLSSLGLPQASAGTDSRQEILRRMVPEEDPGPFHHIAYDDLLPGIYLADEPVSAHPPALARALTEFGNALSLVDHDPKRQKARGIVVIEEWQARLKRITLRFHSEEPEGQAPPTSLEKTVYRHQRQTVTTP